MGLFSRKKSVAESSVPRLGVGVRLRTNETVATSVRILESVVDVHAPTPYAHMPSLHEARVSWHGAGPPPAEAWSSSYGVDDIFIFTFWPLQRGAEFGLFPLGSDEQSLNTPLLAQWRESDSSLTQAGRFEARLLSLDAPRLPDRYYEDILETARKEVSNDSIALLARQASEMFLIKAGQFISNRDARAAKRFVDQHLWTDDIRLPNKILEDLGEWNPQVIPYIQDLPGRIRGLLLEEDVAGNLSGHIWQRIPDAR